jgi:hypothetical protein
MSYGQGSYYYYGMHLGTDKIETKYDANGNLISFKVSDGSYVKVEITADYNAENNPVLIQSKFFKAHYEYNDYGYPTLIEIYDRDSQDREWVSHYKKTSEYDTQGKRLNILTYKDNGTNRLSYEYYDEHHYSSTLQWNSENDFTYKEEFKYGADGKLGAMYSYEAGEPSVYFILYPNTLDNSGNANEPLADMRIWSYAGTLHVRTAQPAVLHIYTLAGTLHVRQTLSAGETAIPLPPGMYVVRIGNVVRKAVIR